MIIIVPAPNNENAPDTMVDKDAVVVPTIAFTMSRNAASPLSAWMAT
jgi:hypothetical protein